MRFTLLGLWLIALPLFAKESVSFRNEREGQSFYHNNSTSRQVTRALNSFRPEEIIQNYRESLASLDQNKLCAFDLNADLKTKFERLDPKFNSYTGVIHYLRAQNEIDDVVVKILLDANETVTKKLDLPKDAETLRLPKDEEKVQKIIEVIGSFSTRFQKNSCFDEAYRSLVNEISKIDESVKDRQVEALFVEAHTKKLISTQLYISLEQARVTEVNGRTLGLKSYAQKIKSLRANKPLRDRTEKSNFVTQKFDRSKLSRRQKLMANYSDLQIMLMGDVVKRLRSRLESNRIEILVWGKDELQETIPLEPMERFRFSLKLLRKEMLLLSTNTYFNGRSPDYMDLMTAAYEVSIIPASELDELAGLQEIWNPKKSLWDKAQVWVRAFSSIATIAIPPPYGFIPALVLVVIEMTTKKNDPKGNDDTGLF